MESPRFFVKTGTFLLGILLVSLACYTWSESRAYAKDGVAFTKAKVTSVSKKRDYIEFEYRYKVDKKEYDGSCLVDYPKAKKYAEAKKLPIKYAKSDPSWSTYKHKNLKHDSKAYLLGGLFLLALVFWPKKGWRK